MALVTVRTAAERLGVAYSTLKRWVHTGRVRTTRTEGGHHRVSDAEIERLLAKAQPDSARRLRTADPDESDGSLGGLSARNRLHGFIDEVRVDGLLAQVRLRVGNQSLTAVITADAVRALKLKRGDDAHRDRQVDGGHDRDSRRIGRSVEAPPPLRGKPNTQRMVNRYAVRCLVVVVLFDPLEARLRRAASRDAFRREDLALDRFLGPARHHSHLPTGRDAADGLLRRDLSPRALDVD